MDPFDFSDKEQKNQDVDGWMCAIENLLPVPPFCRWQAKKHDICSTRRSDLRRQLLLVVQDQPPRSGAVFHALVRPYSSTYVDMTTWTSLSTDKS